MPICSLCSRDKCEYAPEMASFTQPATVPLEAFLYGSFKITKRAFSAPRRGLASFRALSGQCTLSSGECSFKLSKNTELGVKDKDWFISSKREGRRRTPPFYHLRWLWSILQKWTQLTRLADASCMRKAVLMATDFKGAACRGSNGGPARYLSTVGWSHVSLRDLGLAAKTKIPFNRVERSDMDWRPLSRSALRDRFLGVSFHHTLNVIGGFAVNLVL